MSGKETADPKDEDHKDNQKLEHEGWASLKEKKRRCCTDCICLLMLIAVWITMTVLGLIVTGLIKDDYLSAGDPRRLINAIDYNGRICGVGTGVENKPNGYYMLDGSVVCVEACPTVADYYSFICRYDIQQSVDDASTPAEGYNYVPARQCMYIIQTRKLLNRCLPDTDTLTAFEDAAAVAEDYGVDLPNYAVYSTTQNGNASWFNDFLGDLYNLRAYIFGFGLAVALGCAFLYMHVLRIPFLLFTIIWGSILGLLAIVVVGTILLHELATKWAHDGLHSHAEIETVRVFEYIGIGVCVLYTCLILVMRERIGLAIGIVKESAKAMDSMKLIVLVPVLQAAGLVIFMVFWVIYCFFLASSGDLNIHSASYTYDSVEYTYSYRTFEYKPAIRYAFLFMLFAMFWTSEFLLAIGQLVIALSFAAWYFTRDKSTVGSGTVFWALRTTIFHHLGTVAFGSLLIAIIRTIRAVVSYFQRKMKQSHNVIAQYALCCVQCCLGCLERCIRFINKHAYIITAIYSYPFCKATRKAFWLLLRNILRVSAVNLVATFVLIIGRIFIAALTTLLCYLTIIYTVDNNNIGGIIAPVFLCFVLAFWVASMFLEIFGMGIETILYCFIADEEMFAVSERFAEKELVGTVASAQLEHKYWKAKKANKYNKGCCGGSTKPGDARWKEPGAEGAGAEGAAGSVPATVVTADDKGANSI